MGREIQKKKRRSKAQAIRQPSSRKKLLNPLGSNIVAQNWSAPSSHYLNSPNTKKHIRDKKETLTQNYKRLGLTSRLKAPTGGSEKILGEKPSTTKNPFAISTHTERAVLSEAKVERDADGKIIRIISRSANPLNDPLAALDSASEDEHMEEDHEEWDGIREDGTETEVVKSLMAQARDVGEKKPRHQSDGEVVWLQRLVEKYGFNTQAMARDRKLNPMQQTAADLGRRINRLKAKGPKRS